MEKEMEPERKGCLIQIGTMALVAIGMYISIEMEWLYLKNLLLMSSCLIGSFVGERYYRKPSKQTSNKTYIWLVIGALVAAGLLTWLLEGRA